MTTTIRIEGGLLSPDLLERLPELEGQKPKDFGLDARGSFVDQVASVWTDAQTYWKAFERRRAHATATEESVTTITREGWMIPFLEALGYQLTFQRRAAEVDGRTFTISHRAAPSNNGETRSENEADELPIHIVGYDLELGSRPPAGRGTLSPHGLMQDYLNRTEHVWGIVTNGFVLRLLRDSSYLTRPSYIEFDLKQMMDGGRLDEFILLYRLAQRTRLPNDVRDADQCWLEKYHQQAIEQGGRIRDGLRAAVEQTIVTLANGFLAHPKNDALRGKIRDGKLDAREFYRQLLYIIYRLLFLFVAEERNLLISSSASAGSSFDAAKFYREQFAVTRLRTLADEPLTAPERFDDLYLGLRTLFYALANEDVASQLSLPVLNGELFATLDDLDNALLTNRDVLQSVAQLAYFYPAQEKVRRRVNYAALDVEELGSVYESLLDYQPVLAQAGGVVQFRFAEGTERKSTGSYYTAPQLVNELISSALMPVLRERLDAARTSDDKKRAILEMSVIDPAAGSGHFLLAAARALGRELAKIETASDEPSPEATRLAIREVITHCIYGVDKNPRAVDLCKVALWLEGHSPEKPLTFLDHRICNGDSLVGVRDLAVMQAGIPDDAFDPVEGDDRAVAAAVKKLNRVERKQRTLPFDSVEMESQSAAARKILSETPDDTAQQIRKKREAYKEWQAQSALERRACDLWTAAFFVPLTRANWDDKRIPTTGVLDREMETGNVDRRYNATAKALAENPTHRFFHWSLEFPDVFAKGGFDVVLGNPPWDMLQLDPRVFFAISAPTVAETKNMSIREKKIAALKDSNPTLFESYVFEKHAIEAYQKFVHGSSRFPLTSFGRINLMALFAEFGRQLLGRNGRTGMIVPTGIATDSFNQYFFADLVDKQALVSLYDFENREAVFPAVHRSYKFCLLTLAKGGVSESEFAFFTTQILDLSDPRRKFALSANEIAIFNPNTLTAPVFRTRADAELCRKIYHRIPVLENERKEENPWRFKGLLMFMMNTDSNLFSEVPRANYLPLYESKLIYQFDHRWATYEGEDVRNVTSLEKQDPKFTVQTRNWAPADEVDDRLGDWRKKWLLGFRDVTNSTNERTVIASISPRFGAANNFPIFLVGEENTRKIACLVGNLNSIVLDFVARHKVGGIHLNFYILKQLPVLAPEAYRRADIEYIAPRVLELVYTAWDLKLFAEDMGYDGAPFSWDETRRAHLRAELDAYYARLYGLTRDELRYILDPKEVYGEDFPGETFRVLKDKEMKQFGEYRTRRLVLEKWDELVGKS